MGPANLKAIETAAKKLERLDPDYAERMKRNRQKSTRAKRQKVNRDFEKALKSCLARDLAQFDPEDDMAEVDEQDATLILLAANDNGIPVVKDPSNEPRQITLGSKTLTLTQWAEKTGIPRQRIRHRLSKGYSVEKALSSGYLPRRKGALPLIARAKRYEGKTILEWSRETGINEWTIRHRIKSGWPIEQVVSVSPRTIMGKGAVNRMKSTGGGSEHPSKASGPVGLLRSTYFPNRVFER